MSILQSVTSSGLGNVTASALSLVSLTLPLLLCVLFEQMHCFDVTVHVAQYAKAYLTYLPTYLAPNNHHGNERKFQVDL